MRDEQRYDETQTERRKKAAKERRKKVPKPNQRESSVPVTLRRELKRKHHEGRRLSHDRAKNAHSKTVSARSDASIQASRRRWSIGRTTPSRKARFGTSSKGGGLP
jgi:hypothetical protein